MKKGFTLIELLAVIVILAIISAIAIPIVIKVIDNVKISSLKISMSNIEKAIELYINKESINENKVFICSDGQCKDELNNKLEITGIVPEEGTINITPSGTITYNKLIIDGYLCDKYNKKFVCHKASKNIEEVKEESIIIQNTSTSLSNYKIYGNSVNGMPTLAIPTIVESVGEKTSNLFDQSKYTIISDAHKIGFSVENLTIGTEYTISSSKPITWIKISSNPSGHNSVQYYNNGTGVNKYTFTMSKNSNIPETSTQYIFIAFDGMNIPTDISEFNNVQIKIEEGTSATDYEPYGYKIPVKVSGKNLIDISKMENGTIATVDGKNHEQTNRVRTNYIYLQAGTYTLSTVGNENDVRFGGYCHKYSSKDETTWLGTITINADIYNGERNYKTFTLDEDCYCRFALMPTSTSSITNLSITNIANYKPQLEMGDLTDYEPYKDITTNIYLKEPLRKVGNYVDYIDYKNQKLIKNVGIINLSSEDNFELIDDYFVLSLENYPKKDKEISISNYLEYENNFWFDGNKLKLKIEGINTIEELKTLLSDKNIEIHYPLSKSIVSSVELPEINLNKNYSNIKVDTNIKPSNMLIEYD